MQEHNLTAIMGDDASQQPGALAQVLLHETSVQWARYQLSITTPKQPWEETPQEFAGRLREVCRTINAKCKVANLCRDFLPRIQLLIDRGGDDIAK